MDSITKTIDAVRAGRNLNPKSWPGGKKVAVLQGKVWPRDQKEPADWAITWEDEPGNEIGSPGLFGNANDAEVFYDNVKVWAD